MVFNANSSNISGILWHETRIITTHTIYYRDIKDRTVLKLVESDSDKPQRVKEPPPEKRGKRTDIRDQPPGFYETPATAVTDQVCL